MNKSTDKKNRERKYFDLFSLKYKLPKGEIDQENEPDFIIRHPETKLPTIGIEQTNFYLTPGNEYQSEQSQYKRRISIIQAAQALYCVDSKSGLSLTFTFNPSVPIQKGTNLAHRIVKLVADIEIESAGPVPIALFAHIPELSNLYLHEDRNVLEPWRIQGIYDVNLLSLENLKSIIKAKEKKISNYVTCPEYWLLVVIDFSDPAQDQEIENVDLKEIKSIYFKKIILYKTVFDTIIEINCF